MNPDTESQTAHELLRQARIAYYDKADDKACARFLWEAIFSSIRQLAAQMGHPCKDQAQAKEFARYLEREIGCELRYAGAGWISAYICWTTPRVAGCLKSRSLHCRSRNSPTPSGELPVPWKASLLALRK